MAGTNPKDCKDMDAVRRQIDLIDEALVDLLADRFGYIKQAWQIKATENGEALVPWRVQDVVDKVRAQATQRQLPPELIEALWRQMMSWFIQYEAEQLGEKLEHRS